MFWRKAYLACIHKQCGGSSDQREPGKNQWKKKSTLRDWLPIPPRSELGEKQRRKKSALGNWLWVAIKSPYVYTIKIPRNHQLYFAPIRNSWSVSFPDCLLILKPNGITTRSIIWYLVLSTYIDVTIAEALLHHLSAQIKQNETIHKGIIGQ